MNPKMGPILGPKWPSRWPKTGSRERTQARRRYGSKIKRFPLVLKEKREIRVQGRKALANDASNNSVRVNIQRDTCCLVRLQNKHETYQCMHFLSPFCCRAVLLTPWSTQPPSTKIVRTLFAQISMAHRRMSLSYAAFSLTGLSYHFRHLLKTEKCY